MELYFWKKSVIRHWSWIHRPSKKFSLHFAWWRLWLVPADYFIASKFCDVSRAIASLGTRRVCVCVFGFKVSPSFLCLFYENKAQNSSFPFQWKSPKTAPWTPLEFESQRLDEKSLYLHLDIPETPETATYGPNLLPTVPFIRESCF